MDNLTAYKKLTEVQAKTIDDQVHIGVAEVLDYIWWSFTEEEKRSLDKYYAEGKEERGV